MVLRARESPRLFRSPSLPPSSFMHRANWPRTKPSDRCITDASLRIRRLNFSTRPRNSLPSLPPRRLAFISMNTMRVPTLVSISLSLFDSFFHWMDIVIFFHPESNRFLLSSPPLIFLLVERGRRFEATEEGEGKKNVDRFKCSEDGNGRRQCAKIVRRKYPVAREGEGRGEWFLVVVVIEE